MVGAVAPALIAGVSSAHLRLAEREVSAGAPARAILALVRQQHETLLLMLGLACASASSAGPDSAPGQRSGPLRC